MKLTLTNIALVLSLSGFASAASIAVEANKDVDFTANPLAASGVNASYTAYIGVYSGGALAPTATFADINASWTNAASSAMATGTDADGYNGYFALANTVGNWDALGISGSAVYLWVTNGSTENLLMHATGSSTGSLFTFGAETDVPNNSFLEVRDAEVANWSIDLGAYTDTSANAYGGSYVLNTSGIPEPSMAILGAFGVIGLLRRRRP